MVAALPNFVELLHNDLQAIAARVGHERGLEVSSGSRRRRRRYRWPERNEADTSAGAGPARPPESDDLGPEAEDTEVVEVEVETDAEQSLLVQVEAKLAGKNKAEKVQRNSAHEDILKLRDWLEDRWAAGDQVADMVDVARSHLWSSLRGPHDRVRGQEWVQLVLQHSR